MKSHSTKLKLIIIKYRNLLRMIIQIEKLKQPLKYIYIYFFGLVAIKSNFNF